LKIRILCGITLFASLAPLAPAQTPADSAITAIASSMTAGIDWFAQITTETNSLIDQHAGDLMDFAFYELAVIGVIKLALLVIRRVTKLASPVELISDTWWLLLKLVILTTVLLAYNAPVPGGFCLHQIPTLFAGAIAKIFDQATVQSFQDCMQYTVTHLERPSGWYDVLGVIIYVGVLVLMGLLQVGCFIINSFSFFLVAILTVIGPLLIPLVLTEHAARWFYNWLDELFALSMLRAFSAATTYLWAGMLMTFFTRSVKGDYSIARFILLLPMLLMLNVSFLYGMFKLPSVSARVFNGAGAAAQGFVEELKGAVVALAAASL
jgi:hypothetical protein